MKECDKRKAANLVQSIYILRMLDTLLLRLSLHFTTLHPTTLHNTCRHFTSSHLNFTKLHFTTLSFGSNPFKFPTTQFHLPPLHFTSLHSLLASSELTEVGGETFLLVKPFGIFSAYYEIWRHVTIFLSVRNRRCHIKETCRSSVTPHNMFESR
jgi:hypothetical protein